MGLIVGADEDTEAEMESGRGYGTVVCGDETTLAMQDREQISPALGDLRTELDDRDSRDEGVDLGPAARCPVGSLRQPDPHQKFGVDDGRDGGRLIAGAERASSQAVAKRSTTTSALVSITRPTHLPAGDLPH